MEIRTLPIDPVLVLCEVRSIQEMAEEMSPDGIRVYYGFGCNCDISEQYEFHELAANELLKFVNESVAREIYDIGERDLGIELRDCGSEFLLCHEGDIHFTSNDLTLVERVKASWVSKGFVIYEARNER